MSSRNKRTLRIPDAAHAKQVTIISNDSRRLAFLPSCKTHIMKSKKRCISEDPLLNSTSATSSFTSNSLSTSFKSQYSLNISTNESISLGIHTLSVDADTIDDRNTRNVRAKAIQTPILNAKLSQLQVTTHAYNIIRRALRKDYLKMARLILYSHLKEKADAEAIMKDHAQRIEIYETLRNKVLKRYEEAVGCTFPIIAPEKVTVIVVPMPCVMVDRKYLKMLRTPLKMPLKMPLVMPPTMPPVKACEKVSLPLPLEFSSELSSSRQRVCMEVSKLIDMFNIKAKVKKVTKATKVTKLPVLYSRGHSTYPPL